MADIETANALARGAGRTGYPQLAPCTCRMVYLREVRAGDLFTLGPTDVEHRATADAREVREPWMRASRWVVDVDSITDDGEWECVSGSHWTFAVIATDCQYACFGGSAV